MTIKAYVSTCVLFFVLCGCEAGVEDDLLEEPEVEFRAEVGMGSAGVLTTGRLNTPELHNNCGYYFPSQCTAGIKTHDGLLNLPDFICLDLAWFIERTFEYSFTETGEGKEAPLYIIERTEVKHYPSEQYTKQPAFSECERFVVHKGLALSSDGDVSESDTLHVACASSASGKAALWGHAPWAGLERYEAAIRVIRADYCANGNEHTDEEKLIYFLDGELYRGFTSHQQYPLEAVWGLNGAICIESRRSNETQELECQGEMPTCSELGGLDAVLESEEYNVFAVTRLPQPVADDYEEDDSWEMWSAYTGTPQIHNFDRAFDRDWVAVYIPDTLTVRFETKNLQHNADTKLKIFRFDNYIKGELLGANDDFGDPQQKRSQLDLDLDEGAYLIKVINKGPADQFGTQSQWPTYTLAVTLL